MQHLYLRLVSCWVGPKTWWVEEFYKLTNTVAIRCRMITTNLGQTCSVILSLRIKTAVSFTVLFRVEYGWPLVAGDRPQAKIALNNRHLARDLYSLVGGDRSHMKLVAPHIALSPDYLAGTPRFCLNGKAI